MWNIWKDVKPLPDDVEFVILFDLIFCRSHLSFTENFSRGWMHGLAVIHQRRHCLSMVIWQRDAFVTYLLIFRNGKRLNPRTSMSSSWNLHFAALLSHSVFFGYLRLVQLHQNIPLSKDIESILRTEVHVGSTNSSCQVLLKCLCTCDAFHNRNSQWCFWASVSFLLRTSSWQEPFGESLSRLTFDSKSMSEFTLLN